MGHSHLGQPWADCRQVFTIVFRNHRVVTSVSWNFEKSFKNAIFLPKCPTRSKILTIFGSFLGFFDPLKFFSSNFLDVVSEWEQFHAIGQILSFRRRREHIEFFPREEG